MCTWKWDTWEVCSPWVTACGISPFAAFKALKRTECLHFSLFVSIPLSVVSFQFYFFFKKGFWFSLYSLKEIKRSVNFKPSLQLCWLLSFYSCWLGPTWQGLPGDFLSRAAPGIFTWTKCEKRGPREATQTLWHTVLQILSWPMWSEKSKFTLSSMKKPSGQGQWPTVLWTALHVTGESSLL